MTAALPDSGLDGAVSEPLLRLRGVHASYETIEVLHGVDFAYRRVQCSRCSGPTARASPRR